MIAVVPISKGTIHLRKGSPMTTPIGGVASTWATSAAQSTNPMSTARNNVMTAVAKSLGITATQLQTKLQSGESLSQVASAAGVSSDQLNATITSALQQSNLPAGTDIAAIATRMANHVGGHHHHGGGGAGSSSALAGVVPAAQSTSAVSSAADSSTDVLSLLSSSPSGSVNTYL